MIESIADIQELAADPKSGRTPGDNTYNVSWASVAVAAYQEVVGGDEVDLAISDLLGDLMHLADAAGVDFDELLDKARWHYTTETGGE